MKKTKFWLFFTLLTITFLLINHKPLYAQDVSALIRGPYNPGIIDAANRDIMKNRELQQMCADWIDGKKKNPDDNVVIPPDLPPIAPETHVYQEEIYGEIINK